MVLPNNKMFEGRFLRWHKARRLVAQIQKHLDAGHIVYVSTYTKCTKFSKKHRDMFKATKSGAYRQAGKSWVCIDGCKFTVEY